MSPTTPTWPPIQSSQASSQPSNDSGSCRFSLRRMAVKIHYTLEGPRPFSVIARLEPRNLPTVMNHSLGLIDLKSCIDRVLESSPELQPRIQYDDYTIYVLDYSEQDTPFVSQGSLMRLLSGPGVATRSENRIVGRVCKSLSLISSGGSETLEVRLKFVPCPSQVMKSSTEPRALLQVNDQDRPQDIAIDAWAGMSEYLQDPMTTQNLDDASSILGDESFPSGLDDLQQHYTPADTPLEHMEDTNLDLFCEGQIFAIPEQCSPAPSVYSSVTFPHAAPDISRPSSRMSMRSNVSAQSPFATGECTTIEEASFDESRSRKRARLMQLPAKPRGSAFGTTKAPLLQTATSAASVRSFRTGPDVLQQQAKQTDGATRAPTPRPNRHRNLDRRQSGLARSTLRQESTLSSPSPFGSTETLWEPSSEADIQNFMPDSNGGPSPVDFPSSPPVLPFNIFDDSQIPSSPLPQAYQADKSSPDNTTLAGDMVMAALPKPADNSDLFEIYEEDSLLNLPLPMSDSGFFSDGQNLQTPVKMTTPAKQVGSTQREIFRDEQDARSFTINKQEKSQQNRTSNLQWQESSYGDSKMLPRTIRAPSQMTLSKAQSAKGVGSWSHDPVHVASSPAPSISAMERPEDSSRKESCGTEHKEGSVLLERSRTFDNTRKLQRQMSSGFAFPGSGCSSPVLSPLESASPAASGQQIIHGRSSPLPPSRPLKRPLCEISGNAGFSENSLTTKYAASESPSAAIDDYSHHTQDAASKRRRGRPGHKRGNVVDVSPRSGSHHRGATLIAPAPAIPSDIPMLSDPSLCPEEEPEKLSRMKRERIKQAREDALKSGQMPRFCEGCGNVDTPTWRKIFSRRRPGPPPYGSEKNTSYFPISADAWGKVEEHMMYKRNISKEERASDLFEEHILCNSCGIHFNNCGRLRIPIIDRLEQEIPAQTASSPENLLDKENIPPRLHVDTVNLSAGRGPQQAPSPPSLLAEDRSHLKQITQADVIILDAVEESHQVIGMKEVPRTLQQEEEEQHSIDSHCPRTSLEDSTGQVMLNKTIQIAKDAGTTPGEEEGPPQGEEDDIVFDEELFGRTDGLELLGDL